MTKCAALLTFFLLGTGAWWRCSAQCQNYTITVGGGTFDYEIDWELVNDLGATVAAGIAPQTVAVCLPTGCYTMYMYDLFGDGWNGATFVVRSQPSNTIVSSGSLNGASSFGTAQVNLGGGCGGSNCSTYTLNVSGGLFPAEVSWTLVSGSLIVGTGFAPFVGTVCLDTGCFVMQLFDTFGDGWNGATWTLTNSSNVVVGSGSLATGSTGQQSIDLSPTTSCAVAGPIVAGDCPQAVNICTNYSWSIDPNGNGSIAEIPPLGSIGNPDFLIDGVPSPWGSDNYGCLRANELNSTWMVVNISGSGSLEFTFGGLGAQAGFYEWIRYPYTLGTCASILANTVAPIRCNWNGVNYGGTGLASSVPPGADPTNFEPPLNVIAGQQFVICFSNYSSVTTLVPLEFGGTATVSCNPIILPLELLSFTAEQHERSVRLDWSTATESNTQHFEVERSYGGGDWQPIGSLPAAGNSQQTSWYTFRDQAPSIGHLYYRLRMVDADGSHTWSPTVHALFRPLEGVGGIHPNPAHGSFRVHAEPHEVAVHDLHGRRVQHRVLENDGNGCRILLTGAEPGVYQVVIASGNDLRTERLVWR